MPIYEVRDDLLPFRKDGTESFSMLPVGTIFASAVPQIDARVHLLDGSTISQTGIYKTFANLIKSLVAAGHNITYPSDTEFYSDVSTYGQCGKFVIDDVNGTIRLPLITKFIEGLSDISKIGTLKSAGLPNITDRIQTQGVDYKVNSILTSSTTGLFKNDGATSGIYTDVGTYTTSQGQKFIKFDASRGGTDTIYGKSTTVQPESVSYPYYIVLAAGYKSDQVVDMDNIVTELNNVMSEVNGKQAKLTAGNGINIANGVISGVSIKELWTNDVTQPIPNEKTINLSSADYDFLIIPFRTENNGGPGYDGTFRTAIVPKGEKGILEFCHNAGYYDKNGDSVLWVRRNLTYVNDTTYTLSVCYARNWMSSSYKADRNFNGNIIPYKIWGVKI